MSQGSLKLISLFDINVCKHFFSSSSLTAKKWFEIFHLVGELAGFYSDNNMIQDDNVWIPFLRIMLKKGSKELELCCFTKEGC